MLDLQDGKPSRIESFLNEIDVNEREFALRLLLLEEIRQLMEAGTNPNLADYLDRFPDLETSVRFVFNQLTGDNGTVDAGLKEPTTTGATIWSEKSTVTGAATMPPRPSDSSSKAPESTPKAKMPNDIVARIDTQTVVGIRRPPSIEEIDGRRFFADYELLEEIARGGMGVVYKARQVGLNRIVALKMILAGQLASEEDVHRFRAEAEAAANLDHPGIVPIYEVGDHDGQHYFSMGFVDGPSLAQLIAEQPLGADDAAQLTIKVAEAIQFAHDQGIIHRDLKPANVLVHRKNESEQRHEHARFSTGIGSMSSACPYAPRVTDFGLAKQVKGDDQLTATGQILGTPSYMPPEQAAGKIDEIDERSDVYSLGGILYAAVTARPPFQAASHLDTLMQVLEKEPVPPSQLDPKLPRDVNTICMKALEKDPRRRYQTAQEFADDLGRFLRSEPIKARSVSPLERVWRWARRHPIVAAIVNIVALLVTVMLTLGPIVAIRESSLRNDANLERLDAIAARQVAEQAAATEKMAREAAIAAKQALATQKEHAEQTVYARTIQLAYQQWLANNVQRTEELIEKTDPRFRGWEWHFVERLCNSEEKALRGHSGIPFIVRMTRDGSHLVSAGSAHALPRDTNLYVWDVATATISKRLPYLTFAISADAQLAAVEKEADGPIVILNPFTDEVVSEFSAHTNGCSFANFSADGGKLITSGRDKTVRVWDVSTGEKLLEIDDTESRSVHDVVFSPNGKLLAWKNFLGRVQVFDAASGMITHDLSDPIYRGDAYRVAISNDSRTLAVASERSVKLFDLMSGQLTGTLRGHTGSVLAIAFHPDDHRLVTSSVDSTIRVWDLQERHESHRFRGHKYGKAYGVFETAFSPDGKWILSGGSDSTIKLWRADAGDNNLIAAKNESSGKPLVFPQPSQEKDWLVGNNRFVDAVAYSPDGSQLATAGEDGNIRLYDLPTRRLTYTFKEHRQSTAAVAFHPEGELIASGEGGINGREVGEILVWNRKNGVIIQRLTGHSGPISAIAFSPNGDQLFSSMGGQVVANQGEVIGWDWKSGQQTFKNDQLRGVRRIDLSPDGKLIAVAQMEGRVRLLNSLDGTVITKLGESGDNHFSAAFAPNGKSLAVGSAIWDVSVFDLETGKCSWQTTEHSGAITGIAFHPSGRRIISVSVDKSMKIWNAASGELLLDLPNDETELFDIEISPDGNTIACFGEAPYVTLRDLGSHSKSNAESNTE